MAWNLYPRPGDKPDIEQRIRTLSEECRTYPFLIQVLINRGFSDEQITKIILDPVSLIPSTRLTNSVKAGQKILGTLKENKSIAVFADYDCDGVTSGYVMTDGIRRIRDKLGSKSNVIVRYPERREGYGLSMSFCKEAVKNNVGLVITVDNGIAVIEEAKFLMENNIPLIITDHHPVPEGIEEDMANYAYTLVDPNAVPCENRPNSIYQAGVGVAWDVIKAITENIAPELEINANEYAEVVALGTIGDVMPMTPENMALVKIALAKINYTDKAIPFFKEYAKPGIDMTYRDVSWTIAPEVNAAGRIDSVWIAAAALFDKINTRDLVNQLGRINGKRKKLTENLTKDFDKLKLSYKDRFVFYPVKNADENARGLLGLAAGKLMDRYPHYPCYVCMEDNEGVYHGSIRCDSRIPLRDILAKALENECIEGFAGHDSACVLSIFKIKVPTFLEFFAEEYNKLNLVFPDTDDYIYDASVSLSFINETNLKLINSIPLEKGQEATFVVNNALVISSKETKSGGGFLKVSDNTSTKQLFLFKENYQKYVSLGCPNEIDIIGTIDQDFMSNRTKATMRVADLRKSVLRQQ